MNTFNVRHDSILIKVTLLETVRAVQMAYQAFHNGAHTQNSAFFYPTLSVSARHIGGIVLPLNGGNLNELVPREVAHAVIHAIIRTRRCVLAHDKETTAAAIERISARIIRRVKKMGVAL